jgi:hypothetical protein
MIPSHVSREANNITDKLENIGFNKKENDLVCGSNQDLVHPIFLECNQLVSLEEVSPDGESMRN